MNQCWNIVNWSLRNKRQWNFNWNLYIFIEENAFENVVWKKAAILSWPQCECVNDNWILRNKVIIIKHFLWTKWVWKFMQNGGYFVRSDDAYTFLLAWSWYNIWQQQAITWIKFNVDQSLRLHLATRRAGLDISLIIPPLDGPAQGK